MTSFHDILKAGYSHNKNNKNGRKLENEGYIIDKKLSDHNNQIYYNPKNKKLVHNVVTNFT